MSSTQYPNVIPARIDLRGHLRPYEATGAQLAKSWRPDDTFSDKVTVMIEDMELQLNRLVIEPQLDGALYSAEMFDDLWRVARY